MRHTHVVASALSLCLVVACGGASHPGGASSGGSVDIGAPGTSSGGGVGVASGSGASFRCARASVATGAECAHRQFPPSNASSPDGCKSDADCQGGFNGRCVKNPYYERSSELESVRSPLLAEPPRAPPHTECVFDACFKDSDCQPHSRCACGQGDGRNQCVPVDACTSDAECGADHQCACGNNGPGYNYCIEGNCRSDADCPGSTCGGQQGYQFCRTPKDTCKTHTDCQNDKNGPALCNYSHAEHRFTCVAMPPVAPG